MAICIADEAEEHLSSGPLAPVHPTLGLRMIRHVAFTGFAADAHGMPFADPHTCLVVHSPGKH